MLSRRSFKLFFIVTISALFLSISIISCTKEDKQSKQNKPEVKKETVAATVNGVNISNSAVEKIISQQKARWATQMPGQADSPARLNELRKSVIDELIEKELLFQKAKKYIDDKGAHEEAKVAYNELIQRYGGTDEALASTAKTSGLSLEEFKEVINKAATLQYFVDSKILPSIKVDDKTIKQFYDDSMKEIRASHILCNSKPGDTDEEKAAALAKIKNVQERLSKGEKFEDLAKEISDCPSAKKGGDLGFFGRGKMVKPFEDAVFSIKVGEMTDIVKTQFGYHIIKLVEERASTKTGTFDKEKEGIRAFLQRREVGSALAKIVEDMRSVAMIEIKK